MKIHLPWKGILVKHFFKRHKLCGNITCVQRNSSNLSTIYSVVHVIKPQENHIKYLLRIIHKFVF
jgi:hypothetical protein